MDKGLTPGNNDETIRKYSSVIKKPESWRKEKKAEARGKGEISLTIGRILVYKFIAAYLGAVSFWLSPQRFGRKSCLLETEADIDLRLINKFGL